MNNQYNELKMSIYRDTIDRQLEKQLEQMQKTEQEQETKRKREQEQMINHNQEMELKSYILAQLAPTFAEIAKDEKKFIKELLLPIERQKQNNIATGNFRCVGGCGAKVSSPNGACGWAGGGCPACQH